MSLRRSLGNLSASGSIPVLTVHTVPFSTHLSADLCVRALAFYHNQYDEDAASRAEKGASGVRQGMRVRRVCRDTPIHYEQTGILSGQGNERKALRSATNGKAYQLMVTAQFNDMAGLDCSLIVHQHTLAASLSASSVAQCTRTDSPHSPPWPCHSFPFQLSLLNRIRGSYLHTLTARLLYLVGLVMYTLAASSSLVWPLVPISAQLPAVLCLIPVSGMTIP